MIESVTVRQRGAFDFETHYANLCALQNSCPLPSVLAHLKNNVLDLNGDRIRTTDWVPILNTLRINKTLTFVAFRSYFQQTLEEQEKRGYNVKRRTPAIRSKEISYRLACAVKECLAGSTALTTLELQGLPLRERDLTCLSKGLSQNTSVNHLSLVESIIGDEGLSIVCEGIKNSSSVTSINFTRCGLSWKGCETLSEVIKHQAMKRHNEAWQDSLRYRRPDLDRMPGIRRITISSNLMIGDKGASALSEVLKDDLWLKALDLQESGISDNGAKSLLDVLKYNTTIVVLDLRQNPLISQDILRNIMEHVMINCNGQDTDYKWINISSTDDSSKTKKKKRTKLIHSNFGKKATIRISNGRRRTKSTGSLNKSALLTNSAEKPNTGLPWRTAMRADRYKGYPPELTAGKANAFDRMSHDVELEKYIGNKTQLDGSTDCDESSINSMRAVPYTEDSENEYDLTKSDKIRREFHDLRKQIGFEKEARAKAEAQVLALTIDNRRLQNDLEDVMAKSSLLDDEKVLENIESSFKQFHSFLDLLRDAGLGQLVSLAGLDKEVMPSLSRSASGGLSLQNNISTGNQINSSSKLLSNKHSKVSICSALNNDNVSIVSSDDDTSSFDNMYKKALKDSERSLINPGGHVTSKELTKGKYDEDKHENSIADESFYYKADLVTNKFDTNSFAKKKYLSTSQSRKTNPLIELTTPGYHLVDVNKIDNSSNLMVSQSVNSNRNTAFDENVNCSRSHQSSSSSNSLNSHQTTKKKISKHKLNPKNILKNLKTNSVSSNDDLRSYKSDQASLSYEDISN